MSGFLSRTMACFPPGPVLIRNRRVASCRAPALVGHIASWTAFLAYGIGGDALAVILLYLLFRRRGWLRS